MYSIGKHQVSLSDIRKDDRWLEVFLSETPQGYPVFRVSFEGREYEVSFAAARLAYGMSPFYTRHEVMASGEGLLDYGSGRYKLIGRAGLDDHYLHAGEWVEVWIGTQWVAVQVLADEWGRWYFLDADGSRVSVQVGLPARLGD